MQTLKDRMAEAMRRHPELRQADIARACKVKTPSVADWVSGETKSLKPNAARLAAALFGCDQNWIGSGIGLPNWAPDGQPTTETPAATAPAPTGDMAVILSKVSNFNKTQLERLKPVIDILETPYSDQVVFNFAFKLPTAEPTQAQDEQQRTAGAPRQPPPP